MPPKTLQAKSTVIVKILKYFEALTQSEDTGAGGSTKSDDDTEAQ